MLPLLITNTQGMVLQRTAFPCIAAPPPCNARSHRITAIEPAAAFQSFVEQHSPEFAVALVGTTAAAALMALNKPQPQPRTDTPTPPAPETFYPYLPPATYAPPPATFLPPSNHAAAANYGLSLSPNLSAEELAAKQAWVAAKLDPPAWQRAASTLGQVADEASNIARMEEDCNVGVEEACEQLSYEDEAKRAWLAILDAREWEKAADAVEAIAQTASIGGDASQVEAAKAAWVAELDPSTWARVAEALKVVAAEASQIGALTEDCDAGDDVACETLSKEDESKRAWLSNIDVPALTEATAAVAEVADPTGSMALKDFMTFQYPHVEMSADELEALGLQPLGGSVGADITEISSRPIGSAQSPTSPSDAPVAPPPPPSAPATDGPSEALSAEEQAKRAWLARLDAE